MGCFKSAKAALEFPLLAGLFAALNKRFAGGGRFFFAEAGPRTCRGGASENIRGCPQAGTREEAVFEARADHLLEIGIVEIVGLHGADVFVGEVDARDAFIVGGKSYRD